MIEKEPRQLKSKCDRVGGCENKALSKHRCPYQADINGDERKVCNCCTEHMQQCCDDI